MALSDPKNLYNDIINYKSISLIKKRLETEREYLEKNYNTINSLKSSFTIYRNYLKDNINVELEKKGVNLLNTCLSILRLTNEQQKEFISDKNANVKKDKSNLRLIYNVDNYLNTSISLLSSPYLYDNLIGLAAVTGRRIAEIACTAEFKKIDAENMIFDGQLKTKGRIDVLPYQIPVLCDPDLIIDRLKFVREERPKFINQMQLFHDSCSSRLSKKVKKVYKGLFEGIPKTKDLRAIYALICFIHYNKKEENKCVDRDVYFSRILGHSEDDINTCGSYVDFYII